MAKIQETLLVIRMSKLVKDGDKSDGSLVNDEFVVNVESIVQELLAERGILVEVVKGEE